MATENTAADGAAHAASGAGMPQLDPTSYSNQIFWLLVSLVAIYLIVTRIAMPRISSVLSERSSQITNDLTTAEELKQRALDAEAAYEKALADAHAEANAIADEKRAEIQTKLDVELAKADAEIAARASESEKAIADIQASALDAVKEVATDTASSILAALGGKTDDKAIEAAVAKRMKG